MLNHSGFVGVLGSEPQVFKIRRTSTTNHRLNRLTELTYLMIELLAELMSIEASGQKRYRVAYP